MSNKGWRWFDRNYGLLVWSLILFPPVIALIVVIALVVVAL